MWFSLWLDQLRQDTQYASRTLRKRPGFSVVLVLTLALGIGMSTAVFSVFNAVVLRPVAYPNPERLLWLSTVDGDAEPGIVLGPDFVDWREQATSFDRMVAYGIWDSTVVTPAGPIRAQLANVTDDFWKLTGAQPAIGRRPQPGERAVVVLSHAFAERWFVGQSDVIGRTISLEGEQATVVGVLPDDFRFHLPGSPWPGFRPKAIDIYQPVFISAVRNGMIGLFNVVGRLKTGVTLEQARAELAGIRSRIIREHPNLYRFEDQRRLRVIPLHDQLVGGARLALFVLLTAVTFVLLVACANAVNLLLARASTRHHEFAVRVSLGAGRLRVLQQCLVESLILALAGCAAGLLIARLGIMAILRLGPESIPRLAESAIDGPALMVACGLSILTAFVVGLAPAIAMWNVDPHHALCGGSRGASPRRTSVRARGLMLGVQVALALVLLIGAGLMLKSARRLTAYPAGFEPARILTMNVAFSGDRYRDSPARQHAFVDAVLNGLRAQPGVEAVSISTHGYSLTQHLVVEGRPEVAPDRLADREPIMINSTSAALVRVMGLQMVRGRWIADNEAAAVINERLARREFPGEDPIGRRIAVGDVGRFLTIVGIVADLRYSKLDTLPEPEVYVPYSQEDGMFAFTALVRTTGDPVVLAPVLRPLVASIDGTQVPEDVMTLERALGETIAPRRWNLFLLGSFAIAALLLALIGMYGLVSYWVTERHHEIGIRIALGAKRVQIIRMVVFQGMGIVLAGMVVGVIGASAVTRVMSNLLYDVHPTDPQTFAVVTLSLATVTFVACCVPARRAAQVDPAVALRHE